MKKLITISILFFVHIVILNAQENSVELKTAGGTLISSHNSLQAAYNAITTPLSQAYLIEITTTYTGANETFPITLGVKDGASSTNTITIRPAAGNNNAVIQGNPTNLPLIVLDDADYVIFDGRAGGTGDGLKLKLIHQTTTGTNSTTVRFINGATFNKFQYVYLENATQNTAGPRCVEFSTSVSNPTGNSNNQIVYCELNGGRSGIGLSGTAANPNNLNIFIGNKIYNWAYAGVWVLSSSNYTIIEKNEFWQTAGYSTTPTGVIFGAVTDLDIIGNKFWDIQATGTTTVRGISGNLAANATLNIVNNFISLMLDNGTKTSIYGIQVSGSTDYTCNIYYNTIRLGGNHTGGTANTIVSAGIVKSMTGANSTFNMKNNVVLNTRSGGTSVYHTGYFSGSTNLVGTNNIDYNVYYSSNPVDSFHAGWGGFLYNDINQYKTAAAPHEQNTIFKFTNFISGTDLHLTGTSIGDIDLAGTPITGITTDIDGDTRSTTMPYRGADEALIPIPVELVSFNASLSGNSVLLSWKTATERNSNLFAIERKSEGTDWQLIGSVKAAGTTTEEQNYSFTDKISEAGVYYYRLKMIDFDGTYEYSSVIELEFGTPMVYSLEQNYPNPFNPSTTIRYQIPFQSFVTLELYDITGKLISTLMKKEVAQGFHQFSFEANSYALSSGVYFYKLTAVGLNGENFSSTKKLMLLK